MEYSKRASDDLAQNEANWQVAISWFQDHPVAVLDRCSWYSNEELHKMYDYYIPKISNHPLFKDAPTATLSMNFGDKGYLVNICIDECFGRREAIRVPLELFIGLLGLKRPSKLLGWEE